MPKGSSPRMRGTRYCYRVQLSYQGLIPTYAGNTILRLSKNLEGRAHPHVCGEHDRKNVPWMVQQGSSPRMRGTRWCSRPPQEIYGLIPTYAGNTLSRLIFSCSDRAHPHVCGEHVIVISVWYPGLGSSPRMRGTLRLRVPGTCSPGLIPTYAGNTNGACLEAAADGAHPHVCGEHKSATRAVAEIVGSSPRMRGTRLSLSDGGGSVGLIPTYAGNT